MMTHDGPSIALRALKNIFSRRHFRDINFYFSTLTRREVGVILRMFGADLIGLENMVDGRYIRQFEQEFAKYVGVNFAVTFGKGRMALYAVLKAMGIGAGDEIILPGYTCAVVPEAIVYAGAEPCYADIDPETFNIDIASVEGKVTANTKAIIAQHTYGLPLDLDAMLRLARQYNLYVIEDCAHALGAEYKGKKVGSYGDAAIFSLEFSKGITAGCGGVALTNNPEIGKALEKEQGLAMYPDKQTVRKLAAETAMSYFLYHPLNWWWGKCAVAWLRRMHIFRLYSGLEKMGAGRPRDYPGRLTNVQARIGLSQLANLESTNARRLEIAGLYKRLGTDFGLTMQKVDETICSHLYLRFPFLVNNREKAVRYFASHQIELGHWWSALVDPHRSQLEPFHYQLGENPTAERVGRHIVNLPTHGRLSDSDVQRILRVTRDFLNLESDMACAGTHTVAGDSL